MELAYCAYPPHVAADVDVVEQRDGERLAFVVGSASASRYILLRAAERQVLDLLAETRTPADVCEQFSRQHDRTLTLDTLTRFLAKLDEVGVLAGERAQGVAASDRTPGTQFYLRFKLFDPDSLLARMVPYLRWVWTPGFIALTSLLMLGVLLLSVMNWAELASYSLHSLSEHYLAVFLAGTLVGFSHEFAHGLTCKAFGGRSTEVGALMIYYVLPALYCNVSGVHLIPQRNRRLWVIAAGIYWQVLVGVVALMCWFVVAPYTLASDVAFIFFLGSVLDVVFNANPLIKLDGYYFLSQWLRLPNLMDRSRAYWRGLLRRLAFGQRNGAAERYSRRERAAYIAFGLLSFVYTVGLRIVIVCVAGAYLMDRLNLSGLLLTACLALFYMRRALKDSIAVASSMRLRLSTRFNERWEKVMAPSTPRMWRRRLVPVASLLLIGMAPLMPWTASVGNYGTLIAIPGHETIIRAPENSTLIQLQTRPGDRIAAGAVVGRMSDLDLDDQLIQVQSELSRAAADYTRVRGELAVRGQSAARAELQLQQRSRDFDEVDAEQRQVERVQQAAGRAYRPSLQPVILLAGNTIPIEAVTTYPAAIAVLQAEIDSRRTQLQEAGGSQERTRKLFAQGLVPRSELDAADARAATLQMEWTGARERLEAALVEHRRKHTRTATDLGLARSDLDVERVQIESLYGEMQSVRHLVATLEERRDLLQRKRAALQLVAPRGGTVFGEDLPRMTGHYFQKGAEVLRVAETSELLLRIQVPEREIGDVRVGCPVRLKTRSFPDAVFHGVVSNIGGESEKDQYGQGAYRVELTVENPVAMLRPGMTAFARIDFGRQMIGRILVHKIKQALRPELWML